MITNNTTTNAIAKINCYPSRIFEDVLLMAFLSLIERVLNNNLVQYSQAHQNVPIILKCYHVILKESLVHSISWDNFSFEKFHFHQTQMIKCLYSSSQHLQQLYSSN